MSQSSTTDRPRRTRRDTRRAEIASAARSLREGTPHDAARPRAAHPIARHDLAVIALLAALFLASAAAHRGMAAPDAVDIEHGALRLAHPEGWLPPSQRVGQTPRLARAAIQLGGGDEGADSTRERTVYVYPGDPMTHIEVDIRPRPPYTNLPAALALARAIRYGERYAMRDTGSRAIAGRDWFRTEYRYTYGGARSPRIARAVEYAAPSGEALYVVTLHGDARSVAALERKVAPSLALSAERAQRGGAP